MCLLRLAKACYKKRFARINADKLTKSVFYAWSEDTGRRIATTA